MRKKQNDKSGLTDTTSHRSSPVISQTFYQTGLSDNKIYLKIKGDLLLVKFVVKVFFTNT